MKKYYPTYWSGCNPLHEVKDWAQVRSLVKACKNGEARNIPPIYIDGDIGSGSLLTGTHRAAANDIITMLNERGSDIELISHIDVNDYLSRSQIEEISEINDDVQEVIDAMIA
jgi:hypothetical protein